MRCRNRQETRMITGRVTSGDFLLSMSWHGSVRRVGAAGRARDAGNSLDWPVNLKPASASRPAAAVVLGDCEQGAHAVSQYTQAISKVLIYLHRR